MAGSGNSMDIDQLPSPVNIREGAPLCSICLEVAIPTKTLAITNLKCGHTFHLSCIGNEFNIKGAMQCPNCRDTEDSQWTYCVGNPNLEMVWWSEDSDDDSNMDDQEDAVQQAPPIPRPTVQLPINGGPYGHIDLNVPVVAGGSLAPRLQPAGQLPTPAPAARAAAAIAVPAPAPPAVPPASAVAPAAPAIQNANNRYRSEFMDDVADRFYQNYLPAVIWSAPVRAAYDEIERDVTNENQQDGSFVMLFGNKLIPPELRAPIFEPTEVTEAFLAWVAGGQNLEDVNFPGMDPMVLNEGPETEVDLNAATGSAPPHPGGYFSWETDFLNLNETPRASGPVKLFGKLLRN